MMFKNDIPQVRLVPARYSHFSTFFSTYFFSLFSSYLQNFFYFHIIDSFLPFYFFTFQNFFPLLNMKFSNFFQVWKVFYFLLQHTLFGFLEAFCTSIVPYLHNPVNFLIFLIVVFFVILYPSIIFSNFIWFYIYFLFIYW